MKHNKNYAVAAFFFVLAAAILFKQTEHLDAQEKPTGTADKLLVVWTSADKDVAMKMVCMYTYNAKKQGWFDTVQLLVWGPSSRLLSEDAELQEYIVKMREAGVILTACKACADMYGVSGKLESLSIEVKYMGQPLTDMLKSNWKVLTF